MQAMVSIRSALEWAVQELAPGQASARLDAEVLLGHVLHQPRAWAYVWPHASMEPADQIRYQQLVARRRSGEPVAYLTGRREFWSLDLEVTPATLIPRPETEQLVEAALSCIPPEERWRIVDLGTGCGAVALALARERPLGQVLATDISMAALAIAQANARRLGFLNVSFQCADWCAALPPRSCQLIVSNPPYIPEGDPHLAHEIRFEPSLALRAGQDGLAAIRRIAQEARRCLTPGGRLILEHGYNQGTEVGELLDTLRYREIQSYRDLAGWERVTQGTWVALFP
jgi:release factor glutamine methyltransferase